MHAYEQKRRPPGPPAQAARNVAGPGNGKLAQLATDLNARPQAEALEDLSRRLSPPVQRQPNRTGLPDTLKSGIESLSGMSLDPVRVRYNSAEPARFQAHAVAQGHDIHLAPGQERHLPHEAWHVVQQMQGRVPATLQMNGTSVNDDPGLEAEADRMGAQALQMKRQEGDDDNETLLRAGLLGSTSLTPVQRALWDYLPSWQTAKSLAVGGAVGTGLFLGGLAAAPAALGLGLLSAAATRVAGVGAGLGAGALGLAGGAAGMALGGPVGAAVLGGVGSAFGGTLGADAQSKLTPHPKQPGLRTAPKTEEVIWQRALEKAEKIHPVPNLAQIVAQIDDPALRNNMNRYVGSAHVSHQDMKDIIEHDYSTRGRYPQVNSPATAPANITAVRNAVNADPFIQDILNGTQLAPPTGYPQAMALNAGPTRHPPAAAAARNKFNALVSRPAALPPIDVRKGKISDPISYMSDTGRLSIGWGSSTDTLVHEMGHHLENNLEPTEFGSMHSFLLARSSSNTYRKVGYNHLSNSVPTAEGYDADVPVPDVGLGLRRHAPLTSLGADFLGMQLRIPGAEQGVDKFVQHHAHTQESSYATQVYDGGDHRTEFLATTIHLMAAPASARALINADPLRVALFLSLAQPQAYGRVHQTLQLQGLDLDQLIHKLN
ncbi:MAG: DUF4157 domain-containing protein [Azospirillaceae bacterium]|nr:DUF4157 domain-containing protein [Azospirillaceae bacterium]